MMASGHMVFLVKATCRFLLATCRYESKMMEIGVNDCITTLAPPGGLEVKISKDWPHFWSQPPLEAMQKSG